MLGLLTTVGLAGMTGWKFGSTVLVSPWPYAGGVVIWEDAVIGKHSHIVLPGATGAGRHEA